MFTGIIEEIGIVAGVNKAQAGVSLEVKTQTIYSDAKLGDSIAINGVCLSIVDIKKEVLSFDVIQETISRTNLSGLKINDRVNLERSLKADSRISGHFVSGHVDYKGKILDIIKSGKGIGLKVSAPQEFSNLIAEKGSIALDGVSLTVADVSKEDFAVYLIPHTLEHTTFGRKKKGDVLNVETDLIAKYLARQTPKTDLKNLLKKYDYI